MLKLKVRYLPSWRCYKFICRCFCNYRELFQAYIQEIPLIRQNSRAAGQEIHDYHYEKVKLSLAGPGSRAV
jgi:hypothetical protein